MAIKAGGVVVVASAALLAGFWLGRLAGGDTKTAPVRESAPSMAAAAPAKPVDCPQSAPIFPGQPLPSIADATPAEIAALRQAEAARSQSRPPVATYKGPDGRQHAFRYESTPEEALREHARQARERELMAELEADPAAFARRYHLQAREVERILDGSLPMPPELTE